MGAWLGGHLQNWLAPQSAGQWRSGPLPEGVAVTMGKFCDQARPDASKANAANKKYTPLRAIKHHLRGE
jgi:hypothetical protein